MTNETELANAERRIAAREDARRRALMVEEAGQREVDARIAAARLATALPAPDPKAAAALIWANGCSPRASLDVALGHWGPRPGYEFMDYWAAVQTEVAALGIAEAKRIGWRKMVDGQDSP